MHLQRQSSVFGELLKVSCSKSPRAVKKRLRAFRSSMIRCWHRWLFFLALSMAERCEEDSSLLLGHDSFVIQCCKTVRSSGD